MFRQPDVLYLPNSIARVTLQTIADVTGDSVLYAVLRRVGLEHYIGLLPPDNIVREFPFATYAALLDGLTDYLGEQGAKAVQAQIGRRLWRYLLRSSGGQWSVEFFNYYGTPEDRLSVLIPALAYSISRYSDLHILGEETPDSYNVTIRQCALCHGRRDGRSRCHVWRGLVNSAVQYAAADRPISSRDSTPATTYRVYQQDCMAAGDKSGLLVIPKSPP